MTKVLEARMQRHPGLIFARAACSSLQHNSIVSCPRHRDLRGRRRTFAGSTRQASRPPANYLHGEHEPPRQAEVLRRARPSRPPANLRGKHTPTSGLPARTSAANTNLLGCKIVLRQDLRRERTTPASLFSGRRNLRMQNCARH